MSEFLVVSSTFARAPLLALVLVFGLLVGLAGLFLRINSIAFGEPRGSNAKAQASYVPMFAHLALVLSPPASTCRRLWSPGFRTSPDCLAEDDAPLLDIIPQGERVEATGPGRASSLTPQTSGAR